ncbi:MAG: DNA-3-methyladenine glycosylase [Eubacteriales bacterium]|nr:DNA-3-methyladenine glycosylase [Eubacteriales bacterium]
MDYIFEKNTVKVPGVSGFDLGDTLMCGQSFRWRENPDGSFSGTAYGRSVTVKLEKDDFYIIGTTAEDFENIWRGYFDLDTDYEKIREELSKLHPTLGEAAKFAPGIRILRQEPFEALISFIISQNNNIKRIEGIVDRLCENFGEENESGEYAFPTAEKLAKLTPEELSPIRAGFRHRYIIDASQKVASGEVDLERCRANSFEEAKRELMTVVGVGEKVADCVLLYGLHKVSAFPMDVWMKRAMKKLFPDVNPESFGEYAGVAQQYIFHYSRLHPELFDE